MELEADCTRCFGLCCVALTFAKSADFAIDKPAGQACPNLENDFRCAIHAELRQRGFPGCSAYDCLGAGQHVSQVIYGGRGWHSEPAIANQMFAVFHRVRELHELAWYVREALELEAARRTHPQLQRAWRRIGRACAAAPDTLLLLDLGDLRREVTGVLRRASELARRAAAPPRQDYANADLIGARMAGKDLRGANLRGAQLIAADLRGADLRLADLTAADLRDADLRGANLSEALFVRQSQLDSARGDSRTGLPARLRRPAHWLTGM